MIILLFITFFVSMFLGIPIAFSMILSVIAAVIFEGNIDLTIVVQRLVNGGASFTMLALPLFIFAGNLMMYGSTSRLMNFANMLIGRIPGSIGTVGVVGSAFFGSVSGSGVATTAAVGSIVAPEMVKQGYRKGYTASLLAASGTLGVLIPPSIVAIVYGSIASTSIGKQLIAGAGPGFLIMLALIGLNTIIALRKGIGNQKHKYSAKEKVKITLDVIPPLLMPIIIFGGIMSGLITATESAVIATVYALILSMIIYREIDFKKLMKVTSDSVVTSAVILLIMAAAAPFSWTLAIQQVPQMLMSNIASFSTNPIVIMTLIVFVIIILGIFMEGISIVIIMTPIMLPLAVSVGIDPIHFGTIMLAAINIGAVTPPLAVGLFVSTKIVNIPISKVFPDVFYIIIAMLICVAIIVIWPALTLWLPNLLMQKL
ncbi:TRAP transporter large permease [Oceanobacillus saliphilus]|uniref:TRAP transporter large permease n=1 Tax=Oceanobacillus saliphilus TaxID=2925834 RepID=UPI00201DAE56|nr:TRAP transporter large permease [Oceanobacillus saliphilus]